LFQLEDLDVMAAFGFTDDAPVLPSSSTAAAAVAVAEPLITVTHEPHLPSSEDASAPPPPPPATTTPVEHEAFVKTTVRGLEGAAAVLCCFSRMFQLAVT